MTSAATRALLVAYGRERRHGGLAGRRPASAAKRVGLSRDRPILGVNPRAMLRTMLENRAPLYGRGRDPHRARPGGREPEDVIAEVVAVVSGSGER